MIVLYKPAGARTVIYCIYIRGPNVYGHHGTYIYPTQLNIFTLIFPSLAVIIENDFSVAREFPTSHGGSNYNSLYLDTIDRSIDNNERNIIAVTPGMTMAWWFSAPSRHQKNSLRTASKILLNIGNGQDSVSM